MEIRPVAVELFQADGRTDGRTDMMKLTVAFHNFPNASENRQRRNTWVVYIGCPTTYQTWQLFNNFTTDAFRHIQTFYYRHIQTHTDILLQTHTDILLQTHTDILL